jgi:hypothetical protein
LVVGSEAGSSDVYFKGSDMDSVFVCFTLAVSDGSFGQISLHLRGAEETDVTFSSSRREWGCSIVDNDLLVRCECAVRRMKA